MSKGRIWFLDLTLVLLYFKDWGSAYGDANLTKNLWRCYKGSSFEDIANISLPWHNAIPFIISLNAPVLECIFTGASLALPVYKFDNLIILLSAYFCQRTRPLALKGLFLLLTRGDDNSRPDYTAPSCPTEQLS